MEYLGHNGENINESMCNFLLKRMLQQIEGHLYVSQIRSHKSQPSLVSLFDLVFDQYSFIWCLINITSVSQVFEDPYTFFFVILLDCGSKARETIHLRGGCA